MEAKYPGIGKTAGLLTKVNELHKGKFLTLNHYLYKAPNGTEYPWEGVARTNPSKTSPDCVGVLPFILREDGSKDLLLIANYRPPVDKFVLEIPGGLIDMGETPEEAAFRELKEETGYTASRVITQLSSFFDYSAPWMTSESAIIMPVEIDGTDSLNQAPKQDLDQSEVIKIEIIPGVTMKTIFSSIETLVNKKSYALGLNLVCFMHGIQVRNSL